MSTEQREWFVEATAEGYEGLGVGGWQRQSDGTVVIDWANTATDLVMAFPAEAEARAWLKQIPYTGYGLRVASRERG